MIEVQLRWRGMAGRGSGPTPGSFRLRPVAGGAGCNASPASSRPGDIADTIDYLTPTGPSPAMEEETGNAGVNMKYLWRYLTQDEERSTQKTARYPGVAKIAVLAHLSAVEKSVGKRLPERASPFVKGQTGQAQLTEAGVADGRSCRWIGHDPGISRNPAAGTATSSL